MSAVVEAAPWAPPTYATRRDPQAPTRGGRVGVIAAALGTPLMPWQQYVADVALERRRDDPTRWRYPVVVITVPRQSGKTTLLRAMAVERSITQPHQLIFATAQTGKDAGERWKDMVTRVEQSPLGSRVRVYRGAGAQSLILPNGSQVRSFAPTPKSIHGYTPHMVMIDEAWAFDAAQGEDLMAAIRPAQITLEDRQLLIVSTAGTADSAFLRSWVDAGRAATGDPDAAVAYFEWSLPEGLDPYDSAHWDFHPAVGHTITLEDLGAEAEGASRGNWERSYMNRWTVNTETALDLDALALLTDPDQKPPTTRPVLAYDVAQDRSGASVWAGWREAGVVQLRQVVTAPGVSWLPSKIKELRAAMNPRLIGADDGGPARAVTDALRLDGVEVETLGARDYGTACSQFSEHITGRSMRIGDGASDLQDNVRALATKFLADQTAWDPRKSTGPIDNLRAATVAARLVDHGTPAMPKPEVYS